MYIRKESDQLTSSPLYVIKRTKLDIYLLRYGRHNETLFENK